MIEYLQKLSRRLDLDEEEAAAAMALIMRDEATPIQVAGFIAALRVKGETAAEVTGMARTARAVATPIVIAHPEDALDTCGTGGDGSHSFNISTLAAIVAAGCGLRVAKHGNRAASSSSGSADVLEALGVAIDPTPERTACLVDEVGIGFLFAPLYHPSFRFAGVPRRELGIRTVFNLLGPLCNPAHVGRQSLGVADPTLAPLMAEVLERLGLVRALVFCSEGLDELGLEGESLVIELGSGGRREYSIRASELGLSRAGASALRGGTPADNAAIALEVLGGALGPRRDVVCLNAAAALIAGGLAHDFQEGVGLAREALDSGSAAARLARWIEASNGEGAA
ncbi:MAG: anthranilate phosphoribosyltransferase [Candidatus Dormibacteraceae bacterium]